MLTVYFHLHLPCVALTKAKSACLTDTGGARSDTDEDELVYVCRNQMKLHFRASYIIVRQQWISTKLVCSLLPGITF